MNSLRRIRDLLERYQDKTNKEAGRHVIIPLTVSLLAELINAEERAERASYDVQITSAE